MKSFIFRLLIFNLCGIFGKPISLEKFDDCRKIPFPSRVLNRQDEGAAPVKHLFMAKIYNGTHERDGMLISGNYVLSAASFNSFGRGYVVLGDDEASPHRFDIVAEFVHPEFSPDDSRFNFQLLQLNTSVKFDENIRSASLSRSESKDWIKRNIHLTPWIGSFVGNTTKHAKERRKEIDEPIKFTDTKVMPSALLEIKKVLKIVILISLALLCVSLVK